MKDLVSMTRLYNRRQRVSDAMTRRLPAYYRHLRLLEKRGVQYISSRTLGEEMGLTDSQIRQDLSSFGGFGRQGRGYQVSALRQTIESILGLDQGHHVVIIGAGRLGTAIAAFRGFSNVGFTIAAMFDANPAVCGTTIEEIPVLPIDEMEAWSKEHPFQIAVIAVPKNAAQSAVDAACACGVRGVLNFAETDISVPEGVLLRSVHLSDSLMALSFRMHEEEIISGQKDDWL